MSKVFVSKAKRVSAESIDHQRNMHVDAVVRDKRRKAAPKPKAFVPMERPIRAVCDPLDREWSGRYLKHVAGTIGFTRISIRESIPILQRYYRIAIGPPDPRSPRASLTIALAKAIREKTNIEMPPQN